ncbi:DinB family protein [Pedobacter ginsengisoli]|uniref:DinB family protein n=1 Tax=Pedobacter ginsengisoli TaxID=363852 RepID=UPI00254CCB83|nr:DinB family protein [Pedobacter ginsengisoli]
METKTASSRMEGLLTLFDMQTTFFARAIEGISEEDMHSRLNTKANHMAWLTGSLVAQRYYIIKESHPELKQTGADLFEDNKGIQDGARYPSNAEYLKDWEKVSPIAREVLVSATDEKLDSVIDMGFMKMSYYELISFTIYREASIIGQLALWRRLLDYPALRYD